jgi:hypothetical protein
MTALGKRALQRGIQRRGGRDSFERREGGKEGFGQRDLIGGREVNL